MPIGAGLGILGGGLLSGIGSIFGSNQQAKAASQAAQQQAASQAAALRQQQSQFEQTNQQFQPYYNQGAWALPQLSYLLGTDPTGSAPGGLAGSPEGSFGGLLAPYNNGQAYNNGQPYDNGQLYNGGAPFNLSGWQSGLSSGPSPGPGQAGYGSPTVSWAGPNAVLQAPAPYQNPNFTFGMGQTGLSSGPSGGPNSGRGYAGPGANGIASYQAPDPFNYTAADYHRSPGFNFALHLAQNQARNQASAGGGGNFSGNLLNALQKNAVGLADQDFNSQEQLAQQAYNMNAGIGQNAYLTNLGAASGAYNTNTQNALNQYNTNLSTGSGIFNTNYANQANQFNQGLNQWNAGLNAYNSGLNAQNTAFNQNLAGKQNIYNMLNSLVGSGQNAAGQQGALGAQNANQVSSLLTQQGASNAAGTIGQANALGQGITGATNAFGGVLGQLGMMNYLGNGGGAGNMQSPLAGIFGGGGGVVDNGAWQTPYGGQSQAYNASSGF